MAVTPPVARGATLISLDRGRTKGSALLSVRFLSAREFVSQYAGNLEQGGLFVRDADSLSPLEEVAVDLYLPGFKCFRLKARVTHVVTPANAKAYGSPVGAGLELVSPPQSFKSELLLYLRRIGERGQKLVLVTECKCTALLESAGYWCRAIPQEQLQAEASEEAETLRAIVIPPHLYTVCEELLCGNSARDLLVLYDKIDRNRLLTDLDTLLP